jgi:type IV secretory pathway VirB10-like protein
MRSARNFSPEWGYLAPAPSFARTARIVLVATAIGATAGAGVVLSLIDRSPEPERTSVASRAIVTGLHETAAPAASQISAVPVAPVPTAPVAAPVTAPLAPPASSPASSPVAPSEVATQSPNHALVPPSQPAEQRPAAPSTEANASAQAPAPSSGNTASASANESSATQPNSESANPAPHPASGVAALSDSGTAADPTDGGETAQEQAAQKKVKHHNAYEKTPLPGLGTFFRRFFVAHAARPNYSNR